MSNEKTRKYICICNWKDSRCQLVRDQIMNSVPPGDVWRQPYIKINACSNSMKLEIFKEVILRTFKIGTDKTGCDGVERIQNIQLNKTFFIAPHHFPRFYFQVNGSRSTFINKKQMIAIAKEENFPNIVNQCNTVEEAIKRLLRKKILTLEQLSEWKKHYPSARLTWEDVLSSYVQVPLITYDYVMLYLKFFKVEDQKNPEECIPIVEIQSTKHQVNCLDLLATECVKEMETSIRETENSDNSLNFNSLQVLVDVSVTLLEDKTTNEEHEVPLYPSLESLKLMLFQKYEEYHCVYEQFMKDSIVLHALQDLKNHFNYCDEIFLNKNQYLYLCPGTKNIASDSSCEFASIKTRLKKITVQNCLCNMCSKNNKNVLKQEKRNSDSKKISPQMNNQYLTENQKLQKLKDMAKSCKMVVRKNGFLKSFQEEMNIDLEENENFINFINDTLSSLQDKNELENITKSSIELLVKANMKLFLDDNKFDLEEIQDISKKIMVAIQDQAKIFCRKEKQLNSIHEF